MIRLRGYHSTSLGPGNPGDYKLELPQAPEVLLPLLTVRTPAEYASVEERTAHVAERIGIAFDILEANPANNFYLQPEENGQAIWVSCAGFKHDFRVLTITEEDAARVPRTMSGVLQKSSEVAQYVKSVLEAYHKLFLAYKLPEETAIVTGTKEGKILKRIFLDAQQHASQIRHSSNMTKEDIIEAINMLPAEQRLRLYGLPLRIPWDWQQGP